MSKEGDCRRNAADFLELARRAPTSADKARLLGLAGAWLDLAERIHRIAGEQVRKLRDPDLRLRS